MKVSCFMSDRWFLVLNRAALCATVGHHCSMIVLDWGFPR